MNKQSAFPMSNELALELIQSFLQPGMPTLGMWFGWNQPEQNDQVKLGSVYATHTMSVYWEDLFEGASLDDKKEFVKLCKLMKHDPREVMTISGLWNADEVFFPFNKLDNGDKCLYRLHVMAINTGSDYHNWAVEFGERLAEIYWDNNDATCEWELYEEDNDFSREMWDIFKHLLPKITPYVSTGNIYPPNNYHNKVDEDILEWLNDYIANRDDFWSWMFGIEHSNRTYINDEDDVCDVLTWFIEWMQKEWLTGNLQLTTDTPSPKLNAFVEMVNNSQLLPGFDAL
jgi:hypothetical protein